MNLRIDRTTLLHVYLVWDRVPGAVAYWLFKDGVRVSWIGNGDTTTTRFLKPISGSAQFGVMAVHPGVQETVTYPVPEPEPEPEPDRTRLAGPLMPLHAHKVVARAVVSSAQLITPRR